MKKFNWPFCKMRSIRNWAIYWEGQNSYKMFLRKEESCLAFSFFSHCFHKGSLKDRVLDCIPLHFSTLCHPYYHQRYGFVPSPFMLHFLINHVTLALIPLFPIVFSRWLAMLVSLSPSFLKIGNWMAYPFNWKYPLLLYHVSL